jgi:hypothetical protein
MQANGHKISISHSAFRIPQGQLVAPKSDEGGRVAPARRTMLGDDGNQTGAHSALRTLHSALEWLFSGIHFGMDDWACLSVETN